MTSRLPAFLSLSFRRALVGTAAFAMVLGFLGAATTPLTAQLRAGDVFVCDQTTPAILRVTATGSVSIVSSGGSLVRPSDIHFDSNDKLLVVDGGANALLRIDPISGQQTVLTNGGSVTAATGLAVEANGNVLVSSSLIQSVVRIDLVSNSQSSITSGGATFRPSFLTLATSGLLYASDDGLDGFSAIHEIDLTSGVRSILASNLGVNLDLAGLPDGRIATALALTNRVIAVDPNDGSSTVLSSAGSIDRPQGVAVDWQGNILLAQGNGAIVRVDPATGDQVSLLPAGPRNLFGMAVVAGQPVDQIPTLGGLGLAILTCLLLWLALRRLRALPKTP